MADQIKIALAGNPNCGKTTLFNALTGSSQYVGNWPGVTVEKKDGRLRGHKDVVVQDLPGIYSLSPYSLEEVVARNYLVEEQPDAILNIVDGTNIERNLYLTTQLVSLGIPVVVAVNMIDVVRKNGDKIDLRKLSQELGCKVVEISALKGDGVKEAAEAALEAAKGGKAGEPPRVFKGSVEHAIAHIEESLQDKVPGGRNLRWYAIKVFERDQKILDRLALEPKLLAHLEQHVKDCEKELDDDAESIITNQRYAYVKSVFDVAVVKKPRKDNLSLSDKVDKVVTNRWLALPIFAAIIWFMYYISVSTVGSWLTDWANDGVFGDEGWHLVWPEGEKAEAWDEDTGAFAEANERIATWGNAVVDAKLAEWVEVEEEGEEADEAADAEEESEPPEVDGENVRDFKLEYVDGGEDKAKEITRLFRVEDEESGETTNYPEDFDEYLTRKFPGDAFDEIDENVVLALFNADGKLIDAEKVYEDASEIVLKWAKEDEEDGWKEAKEGEEGAERVLFVAEGGEEEGEDGWWPLSGFIADYDSVKEAFGMEEPEPDARDENGNRKYGIWIPSIPAITDKLFEKVGISEDGWVHKIVFDVIYGGVGTVLGFVPQIMIVFLFLAFLEDCGYMARVAFIMDRIFHRFGLSGKSFIPMLVGMGCGVPAVLATRTIEAQRDRRMTIMLGTYIPCGAKAAIIAMFVPAFFSKSAWVASAMYFLGIAVIVVGGIILKKFKAFAGDPAPFVMELPAYHMPTFGGVLRHTWDRTKAYMIKAGTIIFAACTVLWVLMHFSWNLTYLEDEQLELSILAQIGNAIKWIFAPLGFGQHWAGAVASVTAELAKEEAPATLAMLADGQEVAGGTLPHLRALFVQLNGFGLGTLAALSFMLFNLFNPPCLVAIATAFREMGSAKWGWICVGFQCLLGYGLALSVYQLGAFFITGYFGVGTVVAIAFVLGAAYLLFRPAPKIEKA